MSENTTITSISFPPIDGFRTKCCKAAIESKWIAETGQKIYVRCIYCRKEDPEIIKIQ